MSDTPVPAPTSVKPKLNLNKPRYDQTTFLGRARHFFDICDPRAALYSNKELDDAKALVDAYRAGRADPNLGEEDIWHAKKLYDSAFHPQTGEKLFLPGRMSFQVPGNMVITGCMLTFYKNPMHVVFWQVINQTFNATVNYTNRNPSAPITNFELGRAYVSATSAACTTALGLNWLISKSPTLRGGIVGRFVPLVSIWAANAINIPLMRNKELMDGITVESEKGEVLPHKSKEAAKSSIMQVVFSRCAMAAPSAILPAIAVDYLEKNNKLFMRNRFLSAPTMVGLVGLTLIWSTPLACAVFPQQASLSVQDLEPEFQGIKDSEGDLIDRVYFNKGL